MIPFEPMWAHLKRVIKPKGAIVFTATQPFTSALVMSNIKMFRYEWSWSKSTCTGFLNANKMPMRAHENVCVFYKALPTYNPQMHEDRLPRRFKSELVSLKGTVYGKETSLRNAREPDDLGYPKSVIHIPAVTGTSLHPTQKPVALMEYLIKTYTLEGETVLDFTMGSGTTGVAARLTGRAFIGIELDPDYFKIAKERIENTAQQFELF